MVSKSAINACKRRIILNSKECIDTILKPLTEYIQIPINGSLTSRDLFHTIIGMSVNNLSVHSVSSGYHSTPCETSMRYHLKKLNLEDLIAINEKILMYLPNNYLKKGRKYRFAIDYTDDPYYGGTDDSNKNHVRRSKAKKSTNSFYSYISLYIIDKRQRFTLSVLPVNNEIRKEEYLDYFISLIDRMELEIEVLCLDREFYTREVIDLLQCCDIPYIIPVVEKGVEIKNIVKGRRQRYADYSMNLYGRIIPLKIAVDVKYMKGKRGKSGSDNLAFVIYGINWSPRKISNVYRTRFAIESSYRMRNIVKPKTSTKDVTVRYLFAIVSFLMRNVWLYLQKKHFTPLKRGSPVVKEDLFRFDMFLLLVDVWIRNKLKARTYVECFR
ncbi:MAG: ISH3 family transposase [Bacteroidales bacterium]|nr:ISH3 family transposase [Bacteroidales bacterium]